MHTRNERETQSQKGKLCALLLAVKSTLPLISSPSPSSSPLRMDGAQTNALIGAVIAFGGLMGYIKKSSLPSL